MRLALGYSTGLPKGFPTSGSVGEKRAVFWMAKSFPDREVLVWHERGLRQRYPKNMKYRGEDVQIDDGYMFAFTYGTTKGDSHFVVGDPARNGEIRIVIAVKIQGE